MTLGFALFDIQFPPNTSENFYSSPSFKDGLFPYNSNIYTVMEHVPEIDKEYIRQCVIYTLTNNKMFDESLKGLQWAQRWKRTADAFSIHYSNGLFDGASSRYSMVICIKGRVVVSHDSEMCSANLRSVELRPGAVLLMSSDKEDINYVISSTTGAIHVDLHAVCQEKVPALEELTNLFSVGLAL